MHVKINKVSRHYVSLSYCYTCFCFRRINHMAINHLHLSSDVHQCHVWHTYKKCHLFSSIGYMSSQVTPIHSKKRTSSYIKLASNGHKILPAPLTLNKDKFSDAINLKAQDFLSVSFSLFLFLSPPPYSPLVSALNFTS
jgi:hypothetical protein